MASVSKQKRMAKKAAKNSSATVTKAAAESTINGKGSTTKKETNSTAATDLSLDSLKISNERTANGVLTSQTRAKDVKIEQYSLSFHGRVLIENATIELNFGRRYGLVGHNGSGKSTFLASLAAREVPIPDHIDVYLLNQEADPCDLNAIDYVIRAAKEEVARLEKEVEDLLTENDEDPSLEDLYDRIAALDESTFQARASGLLYGLGFSQDMMAKKTKDMSGGWRMRVALAKALFIRPTLLLLDEPTNHLDLEACVWLEEYLKTYNRILLLVSHSQDFLDNVCDQTIHLTEKKKLNYYGGGYSTFVKTKAELEVNQMKAYNKQQDEIAHIKKFIASAGTYANLVRQAKSKQKIIDKMEAAGLVEKVEAPSTFKFKFSDVEKLPPPVLQFDQVSFSYNGSTNPKDLLYKDLDLAVDMDSRIALVGPNGVGKSTLLKLMIGELQPVQGRISRHTNLKLAKYSQHSADQLEMDLNPIEYMRKKFAHLNGDVDFWRSQIGRYGLTGAHQTSPIRTLSDGLKTRLVFAELVLSTPDIVLMDEPTNHLDMESIDSLALAIQSFSGGVVLVSHDFRLISQVAQEILLCKDKKVKPFKGSIEDYKKQLQRGIKV
ncbi:P-loop containing nucleoside triphosphate hydrolase protein [Gigaspora margarita]|uniref:P-loop containing nucleoside triphosphate hydrolase protein n=1 Tax=Gigaspora margarita TaxID=4874 RepID=A0A8H4A488_GIGMA|nr:P-loop containing nucleoside triphosphate hydrolase protein [Gigaspora margarita]